MGLKMLGKSIRDQLFGWALATVLIATLSSAGEAKATGLVLPIPPVAQQSGEWCWAAATEMVFGHYNVPNINPGGNYQCGVVGSQGGQCAGNCKLCLNGGGTINRIAAVQVGYLNLAMQWFHYQNPNILIRTWGILSPAQIQKSINDGAPILAGISPAGIPYPPGLGISEHAVVVVGYDLGPGGMMSLVINDPFPPNFARYQSIGAPALQPGRYLVPYWVFINALHYGNSISFDPLPL